jgi:hypothetical protein
MRLEILLTLFRTVGGVRQKGHGRPFFSLHMDQARKITLTWCCRQYTCLKSEALWIVVRRITSLGHRLQRDGGTKCSFLAIVSQSGVTDRSLYT